MKKKILILIDWYLPGFKAGGPIRSCTNLVAHLSNEFDFFIVTRNTDYMDDTAYSSVKKNNWNKLPDGSSVYYISKENISKSYFKRIAEEINPDFILLNGIFSYQFTILPLRIIDKKKYKIVIAVRGMLAPSAIELKFFKKKIFLAASKISRLYDNVLFAASSENEKSQIEKYFPHNEIKIAPNLSRIQSEKIAHPEKKAGELKLLNIARIALEKNLQYALEILKNVKEKVQFDFYGSVYDENYWKKCKEEIQQLPKNISAEYKGAVNSEKIFEIMRDYHFLFLPTRGENFGHIILESMSAGLPVIISDKTPWKNLSEKKAGWDIPLSDPEKFADIIEQCAKMNSDEYKIFSEGAFKQASSYINNQKKIQANRELFS